MIHVVPLVDICSDPELNPERGRFCCIGPALTSATFPDPLLNFTVYGASVAPHVDVLIILGGGGGGVIGKLEFFGGLGGQGVLVEQLVENLAPGTAA